MIDLGDAGMPAIVANLQTGEREFTLIAAHPVPPMRSESARMRNAQLKQLAQLAGSQSLPCVVVGDLNASCWSPQFRDLLKEGRLREARSDQGLHPTWPMHFPTWLLRIPIDHCLVGEGVQVHNFRAGGNIGSEHGPIIADISVVAAE